MKTHKEEEKTIALLQEAIHLIDQIEHDLKSGHIGHHANKAKKSKLANKVMHKKI